MFCDSATTPGCNARHPPPAGWRTRFPGGLTGRPDTVPADNVAECIRIATSLYYSDGCKAAAFNNGLRQCFLKSGKADPVHRPGDISFVLGVDEEVDVNWAPPDIPVPTEPACVVPLFEHVFNDTIGHNWRYADVTKTCGESWAKVVLDLACGVSPGGQYDRSLFVTLKGVNVFAGTTQEPNHSDVGASWHVQADLTHYGAALLAGEGTGSVELDNIQSIGRDALQHCSGSLMFFKATPAYPALPNPATHVVSLGTSYRHADGNTNTVNSSLTATISLPKNTARAELEMTLQNQAGEEGFWDAPGSAW